MKKPPHRPDLPRRNSDNEGRRLAAEVDPVQLRPLLVKAYYRGIAKHKKAPLAFGIPGPFTSVRSDTTLCDRDAGFTPSDIGTIPGLLQRGIAAGLVGHNRLQGIPSVIWSVADNGWIFEGRITNPAAVEYHGYPVRASEAIAELVYRRFAAWALKHGSAGDRKAAVNCQDLYGFRT